MRIIGCEARTVHRPKTEEVLYIGQGENEHGTVLRPVK